MNYTFVCLHVFLPVLWSASPSFFWLIFFIELFLPARLPGQFLNLVSWLVQAEKCSTCVSLLCAGSFQFCTGRSHGTIFIQKVYGGLCWYTRFDNVSFHSHIYPSFYDNISPCNGISQGTVHGLIQHLSSLIWDRERCLSLHPSIFHSTFS